MREGNRVGSRRPHDVLAEHAAGSHHVDSHGPDSSAEGPSIP
jgi:hypothetical protein